MVATAIENGDVSRPQTRFPRNDPTMLTLRKACLGRRREKDPAIRKRFPMALFRARQFIVGTEIRAPSSLKGAPPPTRAPILERLNEDGSTERDETIQVRTNVVHVHLLELCTGPTNWETPEWIW